ncbi:DUF6783 domain-containing protein [Enterocloster hominis (ex Hitch et al. 2024)]|uniref:DUF6783 domain-containing protein n=1 Tax=Enterocloster hominis (ex Hitch et al. 2024) TaxID=1917870 RepID=UPI003B50D6F1
MQSRHLRAPLRGIFGPNSGYIARYAPFICAKSPTKWDAQLTESNFQTHPKPGWNTPSGSYPRPSPPRALP